MSTALFLFHRDLRLEDNSALYEALNTPTISTVIPAFIFTPEQIDPAKNPYFSNAAVQFMCESLEELQKQAHTHHFHGDTLQVLTKIHAATPFQALYQNKDMTYYATHVRDKKIAAWCEDHNVTFHNIEDYDLFPAHQGLVPASQKPYTILAQYYARYLKDLTVSKPKPKLTPAMLAKLTSSPKLKRISAYISPSDIHKFYTLDPNISIHGGRTHGLAKLKQMPSHKTYGKTRDFPADTDGTTKLSAYIKFGCLSIREVYWACVKAFKTRDHPLIRELIFRSFYYRLYSSTPKEQRAQAHLNSVDKAIPWDGPTAHFNAWKEGRTGFPLVDAGMRQLNTTHWMHNRVRMLVASTLTRYLNIDWRKGERYFATQLVDYDPISNVAGWQWGASVGYDNAQTLFRAPMNPFIQSKKFDPDAEYIKKYVPELQEVTPNDIHKWSDPKIRAKYPNCSYPAPIVDQKESSARAVKQWKSAATG